MVPGFDQEQSKGRGVAGTTFNCKGKKTFTFATTFIVLFSWERAYDFSWAKLMLEKCPDNRHLKGH